MPVVLYEGDDGRSRNVLPDVTVLQARCKKLIKTPPHIVCGSQLKKRLQA